jgi:hypothetical protein
VPEPLHLAQPGETVGRRAGELERAAQRLDASCELAVHDDNLAPGADGHSVVVLRL